MSLRQPSAVRVDSDFERPSDPPPPVQRTRLIREADDLRVFTIDRETDAHTALTRGVAEYISGLSFELRGRPSRFVDVIEDFADIEDGAELPRAAVWSPDTATYDASSFKPNLCKASRFDTPGGPEGTLLVKLSELMMDLRVEVWATDKEQRIALMMMLEDAFAPVEFIYGFRLELPHYHNMRAAFELLNHRYEDSDALVHQRYRKATLVLRGQVPVVRVVTLPVAKVQLNVTVAGTEC